MTTLDGSALAVERDQLAQQVRVMEDERNALTQRVQTLHVERDQYEQRTRTLQAEVENLKQRLKIVAEMLLQEANDRNFCADYDRFVDNVNGTCGAEVLLRRARDFYVSFTGSMTVHANSEDDASELCASELGRMEGRSDYSMSWDIGDVEYAE